MKKSMLFLLLICCSLFAVSQSTITGSIKYLNASLTPLDGMKVFLKNLSGQILDSTYADQAGIYTFLNVANGSYYIEPACMKAWGGGNATDAMYIQRHFVNILPLTGLYLQAADITGDGFVNTVDAMMIARRFVGSVTSFTPGNWVFKKETIQVSGNNLIVHIDGLCYGDVDGSYVPPACSPYPTPANAGPDQLNVTGTTTTLGANTPQYGTGTWSIVSGTGGVVAEPNNPASGFSGIAGDSYTLTWTIATLCGSSVDTVVISFASAAFICGSSTLDYGGQTYNTVQIGTQCWMKENLNIGTYVASVNTGASHSDVSHNGIIEKYCYDNDQANCAIYGGLYDWNEMMGYTTTPGIQGICPAGWHIPTDGQWTILTTNLGGESVAGGKMKETGTAHWASPNYGATNSSGFTALPGGYRSYDGYFGNLTDETYFWSSSQLDATYVWCRSLYCNDESVYRYYGYFKTNGFSARCLQD